MPQGAEAKIELDRRPREDYGNADVDEVVDIRAQLRRGDRVVDRRETGRDIEIGGASSGRERRDEEQSAKEKRGEGRTGRFHRPPPGWAFNCGDSGRIPPLTALSAAPYDGPRTGPPPARRA